MGMFRTLGADRRGNAAVEFALGLPVLLLGTLMVFDLGRSLLAYTSVNNLAAEGVRYAVVRGPDSPTSVGSAEVQTFVRSRAGGLVPENLTVEVTYYATEATGNTAEVTVHYNMKLFLNPVFDFADYSITGISRMTVL
jgi:Flp pilus assembly protein TadG